MTIPIFRGDRRSRFCGDHQEALYRDEPSPRRLLQYVEPHVAVDHVDEAAPVERHVVALRGAAAAGGLGDEVADLLGGERVGDVDDAQAAAEPDRIDERALRALRELMRAEARAGRAAEG